MTVTETVTAPAKLTLSLRVTSRRADGYHLLDAEMVTVDLVDSLSFGPGDGLSVVDEVVGGTGTAQIPTGADNLVARALVLTGRRAAVRVVKRIPAGAGLGEGRPMPPPCCGGPGGRIRPWPCGSAPTFPSVSGGVGPG